MKEPRPFLLGAALGLALLISGCETDGLSSRIQEKSAVYATLKPWQKRYVDTGVIAQNFSAEMVYMAIGNPSAKEPVADGELWIYKNYYPSVAASKVRYNLTSDRQTGDSRNVGGVLMERGSNGNMQVAGSAKGGVAPTMLAGGAPQGGSMEPADLQSYTLYVTFDKGLVSQLKITEN